MRTLALCMLPVAVLLSLAPLFLPENISFSALACACCAGTDDCAGGGSCCDRQARPCSCGFTAYALASAGNSMMYRLVRTEPVILPDAVRYSYLPATDIFHPPKAELLIP